MFNKFLVPALAGCIILLFSGSAMATGIGVFMQGAGGETSWETGHIAGDSGDFIVGGGLMLDTNLAKNEVFNYRFKLGYNRLFGSSYELNRLSFDNCFGISPRNMMGKNARFWFGPTLGFHIIFGTLPVAGGSLGDLLLYGVYSYFLETELKVAGVKLDLGLVLLGFNFNFGEHVTLTFEFGGRAGYFIGQSKIESDAMTAGAIQYEGYTSIGVVYRLNDSYGGTNSIM